MCVNITEEHKDNIFVFLPTNIIINYFVIIKYMMYIVHLYSIFLHESIPYTDIRGIHQRSHQSKDKQRTKH